MSDETVAAGHQPEFRSTGLSLLVESPGAHIFRFPVTLTEFSVGGPESDLALEGVERRLGSFRLAGGQLAYTQVEPVSFRMLSTGDELRLGEHRLRVEGVELACLEGHSGAWRGQLWGLTADPAWIGRPGRRENRVSLDHKTVSREHACLRWREGVCYLEVERGASWVNGDPVAAGQSRALSHGDLVRLGELLFGFRRLAEAPPGARLRLYSLGSFEAHLEAQRIAETAWRTHNARWLLARLALDWGRVVSVELLLDEFWPDLPPERGRKNLNWVLSILRGLLRPVEIARTTQAVQLDVSEGWHDLQELEKALDAGQHRQALDLYRGPYLEGCYADWALRQRDRLERRLMEAALSWQNECAGQGDHAGVLETGERLLGWDPCCQPACLAMLKAYRALGRPSEARRLYEGFSQKLRDELGLEPPPELARLLE